VCGEQEIDVEKLKKASCNTWTVAELLTVNSSGAAVGNGCQTSTSKPRQIRVVAVWGGRERDVESGKMEKEKLTGCSLAPEPDQV
jgi:hypothetical protein